MFLNLFGSKKDCNKEEIDKKLKTSVIPPSSIIRLDHESEDEIDVILGNNIKKTKYAHDLLDHRNDEIIKRDF